MLWRMLQTPDIQPGATSFARCETWAFCSGWHAANVWTSQPFRMGIRSSTDRNTGFRTARFVVEASSISSEDHRFDCVNLGPERGVVLELLHDLLHRGNDGRVVLPAERAREVGIAVLGVMTREVHRDGTRSRYALVTSFA